MTDMTESYEERIKKLESQNRYLEASIKTARFIAVLRACSCSKTVGEQLLGAISGTDKEGMFEGENIFAHIKAQTKYGKQLIKAANSIFYLGLLQASQYFLKAAQGELNHFPTK
jgi:hypothetical protein